MIGRVIELKAHPHPFQRVWDGRKRHEVRKDDRYFAVGESLRLREFDPDTAAYTGRELVCGITDKTDGGTWGLPEGLCVLSIVVLQHIEPTRPGKSKRKRRAA